MTEHKRKQAVVRRKGRRLVGVSAELYRRLVKLTVTRQGRVPVAAVTATCVEIGLDALEKEGK